MLVALTVGCGAALLACTGAQHPTGTHTGTHHHGTFVAERSVSDLVDPSTGAADIRATLVARMTKVTISSGREFDAWTWDGTIPGPQLTVRQGELVEVSARNEDVEDGVTVHWHGIDVPGAMDGVAGVTQQAILPGQEFVYRFRPQQAGTFWYHTHQNSAVGVGRGLFGAFIVLPAGNSAIQPAALDRVLLAHTWREKGRKDTTTIGADAGSSVSSVAPGTAVRLRLINTDSLPQHWAVNGTAFTVVAIDGTDVNEPTLLRQRTLTLGAGGRYDVAFVMPSEPVVVGLLDGNRPQQLLLPTHPAGPTEAAEPTDVPGPTDVPELVGGPEFDPLGYGTRAPVPFSMASRYDVEAVQKLETQRIFHNGVPTTRWTINGKRAPDIPMIMVDEGDTARVHIINASDTVHPMHLHGHHVLVLQRNGVAPRGSPWWADTVNLNPGDDVWVAFTADNPGLWMDHCHNLDHQAAGMLMHVGYRGISTPYGHD